jgi:hypothetical protein
MENKQDAPGVYQVIYIRNVPRRMGRSGLHDQKII